MSPDVNNPAYRALSYDELAASYQQQMEAMLEGGVDAILIETIFDTLNAKAAIFAAEQAMKMTGIEVPIMLSVTVSDIGGRTLSGQTSRSWNSWHPVHLIILVPIRMPGYRIIWVSMTRHLRIWLMK